jgi:hypothetical protein
MSSEIENSVTEICGIPEQQEVEEQRISECIQPESSEIERMDSELRFKIKQSFLELKITVCIQLSVDEVAGLRDPVPYYVSS